MNYSFLFLFGIGIGIVSGLLGIGGGILLVPGLMLLFGFSQPDAQGTSLAVLSIPVVMFGALVYYHNGHVRLPVAGCIALGFAVGVCLGAVLVSQVTPENTMFTPRALRIAFGGLLLYTGFVYVNSAYNPDLKRPLAALPEALATLFAIILSGLWRKSRRKPALPVPPGDDAEYHI